MSFYVWMTILDIPGLISSMRRMILLLWLKPCVITYNMKHVKVLGRSCEVESEHEREYMNTSFSLCIFKGISYDFMASLAICRTVLWSDISVLCKKKLVWLWMPNIFLPMFGLKHLILIVIFIIAWMFVLIPLPLIIKSGNGECPTSNLWCTTM